MMFDALPDAQRVSFDSPRAARKHIAQPTGAAQRWRARARVPGAHQKRAKNPTDRRALGIVRTNIASSLLFLNERDDIPRESGRKRHRAAVDVATATTATTSTASATETAATGTSASASASARGFRALPPLNLASVSGAAATPRASALSARAASLSSSGSRPLTRASSLAAPPTGRADGSATQRAAKRARTAMHDINVVREASLAFLDAVRGGSTADMLRLARDAHCDIDRAGDDGLAAVHVAVALGDVELLTTLYEVPVLGSCFFYFLFLFCLTPTHARARSLALT